LLTQARAKIAEPKHWTKGAAARDDYGITVLAKGQDAVCFCSFGALAVTAPADNSDRYSPQWPAVHTAGASLDEALNQLHPDRRPCIQDDDGEHALYVHFNDDANTTHEMVLALFDKAIEIEAAK
jgi:hypothetical protein